MNNILPSVQLTYHVQEECSSKVRKKKTTKDDSNPRPWQKTSYPCHYVGLGYSLVPKRDRMRAIKARNQEQSR
ncbi:uncharacterized protein CLUP02_09281 [Colletotrichum lupini]|uniref:Uncharacterized protein n=1 Tax=Colletotrichum lupini TaxID=145971 RepID=A0A9Q8SVD4_9PEZI|nr:uncharacterized protein CLUP02_09281 [Colletotrichum lupini]UQC83785.1 hypothetical protein CLUP02_09281 [Colletotrichum lupini]